MLYIGTVSKNYIFSNGFRVSFGKTTFSYQKIGISEKVAHIYMKMALFGAQFRSKNGQKCANLVEKHQNLGKYGIKSKENRKFRHFSYVFMKSNQK